MWSLGHDLSTRNLKMEKKILAQDLVLWVCVRVWFENLTIESGGLKLDWVW